jgi:Holliday junction DNA helicase RuvA
MIASLDGVVANVAFDALIVEVGGVGYRVYASPSVLASAAPGSRLKLFTHHVVREDLQALYGFRSAEELGFFGLLLTVTGVGPKVAMAIVGSRPTAELQLAIMQQDQAVLVSIAGIGKRLAERVIFELKEKVAAAGVAAGVSVLGGPVATWWARCRRSATRCPRRARRRAWGSPWPGSARRWRSGSRLRCGCSPATESAVDFLRNVA